MEGAVAKPAQPVSLADAGLRERSDLQEWVINHPQILGPDVLIVSVEFDRWQSATGDRERDRLDVLGLGRDGRLVVAELKRDKAPDTVQMQAVKYAALTSRFTEQTLIEHYQRFRAMVANPIDDDELAREVLSAHVGGELDDQLLRKPRIVLVAGAFPPVVTASVVWLSEMGLDITIQRVQAYRVHGDHLVITVSQLFPVADIEDFTVSPQRAEARSQEERRRGVREKSAVVRLTQAGVVPDGTVLTLRPTSEVTQDVREQVEAWVAADPRRGRAIWHNDARGALEWWDGTRRRPTPIVQEILREAAGLTRSVQGPAWWVLPDGRDLSSAAGSVRTRGGFDWSGVHRVLESLPPGRWTTYGDLAVLVGTAAQPVGAHIATCSECANAHRVLSADGRVNPGFRWSEPGDLRAPHEILQQEGIVFSGEVADPARRLSAEELASFMGDDDI